MDFQKLDLELLKTMPLPDWSDEVAKNQRGVLKPASLPAP